MEFIETLSHAHHIAGLLEDGGLATVIDFFLSADGYFFFILFIPIGFFLTLYTVDDDGIEILTFMMRPLFIFFFFSIVSIWGHCLIGKNKCGIGQLRGWNFLYNWGAFIAFIPLVVLTRTWVFIAGFVLANMIFLDDKVARWRMELSHYRIKIFEINRLQRFGLLIAACALLIISSDSVWFLTVFLTENLHCR